MSGSLPAILADTAAVTEDGTLTATGNILANDSDNHGHTLAVAPVNGTTVSGQITISGMFGTLAIQPNGSWSHSAQPPRSSPTPARGRTATRARPTPSR